MSASLKKLEQLNAQLINAVVFLLGMVLIVVGVILENTAGIWGIVLLSIGCSIVASAIIIYLSSKYLIRQGKSSEIAEKWGLLSIYRTRAEMNQSSNSNLESLKNELDIIAFGLRSFRDSQNELMKDKIKQGLRIRILTMNPDSIYLQQREKDENEIIGQTKKTILDLIEWVTDMKGISTKPENVQIKFYDSLPLEFYFRQDDFLYVGPYLRGITSQQTISYEFRKGTLGYDYWKGYFERLWRDTTFSKESI